MVESTSQQPVEPESKPFAPPVEGMPRKRGSTKRKKRREYTAPREEEIREIIRRASRDRPCHIAFLLAYCAGLRLGEVLKLLPTDVTINSEGVIVRVWGGKNLIDRTVKYYFFDAPEQEFKKEYLHDLPLRINRSSIQKAFHKYSMEAGVNTTKEKDDTRKDFIRPLLKWRFSFHCLRHGFALKLIGRGIPANYVQRMLGHASLAATNFYTHVNNDEAIRMIDLVLKEREEHAR